LSWYQWQEEQLILNLRIQSKASRDEIVGPYGEGNKQLLKVRISAPPTDGKANGHLIKFIARQFGVARSAVELLSGKTGRNKRIAITAPDKFPDNAAIVRAV